MVTTVLRLKTRILRHTLRREPWRVVVLVCGVLWALSMLPSLVGGMVWLADQSPDVTHDVLVIAGSLLIVGWTVVPVLVPGLDDSLEITRFATFGVRVQALVPALLAAALLGVPTLFTGLVTVAPALAWAGSAGERGGWTALTAVLVAPLGLATCVLGSRLSTALAGRLLGSRRRRQGGLLIGLGLVTVVTPAVIGLGALGLEGALERVPTVAKVLGWTPLGLVWATPAAVADGDVPGAIVRATLAVGWVLFGATAWTALLRSALVSPPSRGGQVRRHADGLLRGAPLTRWRGGDVGRVATLAIARRSLRYWATDPRYLAALLGAVVAPVLIVLLVATVVDAPAAVALTMGPLMAATIGWGRHNDVAYDGTAFWMHVSARVPGWSDRLGRVLAVLVWALPVTVVVSLGGAVVAGRPDLAPAALGAALGCLGAGLAVSSVFSTLLPYPAPEAGQNPYAAQLGAVGAGMVAQLVTSMATGALVLPVMVLYGLALWSDPAWGIAALALGLVGGGVVLAAGVVLGGRVHDRRSVRVLARLA